MEKPELAHPSLSVEKQAVINLDSVHFEPGNPYRTAAIGIFCVLMRGTWSMEMRFDQFGLFSL